MRKMPFLSSIFAKGVVALVLCIGLVALAETVMTFAASNGGAAVDGQAGVAATTQPSSGLAVVVLGLSSLAALALGLWLLHQFVITPLQRLGAALGRLVEKDLTGETPHRDRQDEIGQIGHAAEQLRLRLVEVDGTLREADCKSTAFESSSAATMLIDCNNVLQYANPAMNRLLSRLAPVFRKANPKFDPAKVVGSSLDEIFKGHDKLRRRLSEKSATPVEDVVAIDDYRLSLHLTPVRSRAGAPLGRVVELADVTEQVVNSAILSAINTDQARADFDLGGRLVTANLRFAEAIGATQAALVGRTFASLLDPANATGGSDPVAEASAGKSLRGRFLFRDANQGQVVLEAALSCVRDPAGQPLKLLFLGRDVTAEEAQITKARTERIELQKGQARVVDELRVALRRMREGDLSLRITEPFAGDYEELRTDYNGTLDTLTNTLRELIENATGIHGEARDISATADVLSRHTESTAATLEETAAALDQLTNSVKTAAEGAARADREVAEARSRAEKSGEIVMQTVEAMDQISAFSEKITSITKVIEDIAFQTNLLALNAGVEAARAGEAGRGFAVVASEVRALAQRCSEAAREINELIADSGAHVQRGVDLVGQTGTALKEIVTSIAGIATLVSEIAGSAKMQSTGLVEINTAVTELDQSTQQNAARLEETTAASQSLTDDAMVLVKTVSHFRLGGEERKPLAPKAPAAAPARNVEPKPSAPARPKERAAAEAAPPRRLQLSATAAQASATSQDGWSDY